MFVGEEALEMLVDEKETEELRIGERHGDEPWRGDRENSSRPPNRCSRRHTAQSRVSSE